MKEPDSQDSNLPGHNFPRHGSIQENSVDIQHNTSLQNRNNDKDGDGVDVKDMRNALIQLVLVSMSVMLGWSPFIALMNLESIINPDVGLYALTSLYVGTMFSIITSPILTRYFGAKGSFLLGYVAQVAFVAAHFYPKMYVMLPVSFITGSIGNFIIIFS